MRTGAGLTFAISLFRVQFLKSGAHEAVAHISAPSSPETKYCPQGLRAYTVNLSGESAWKPWIHSQAFLTEVTCRTISSFASGSEALNPFFSFAQKFHT